MLMLRTAKQTIFHSDQTHAHCEIFGLLNGSQQPGGDTEENRIRSDELIVTFLKLSWFDRIEV